jgi:hypothetical protein
MPSAQWCCFLVSRLVAHVASKRRNMETLRWKTAHWRLWPHVKMSLATPVCMVLVLGRRVMSSRQSVDFTVLWVLLLGVSVSQLTKLKRQIRVCGREACQASRPEHLRAVVTPAWPLLQRLVDCAGAPAPIGTCEAFKQRPAASVCSIFVCFV